MLSQAGPSIRGEKSVMPTPRSLLLSAWLSAIVFMGHVSGQILGLGKPISPSDFAAWNIDVQPDGTGLPPGSGTSDQGAAIFADNCSACHGENGRGTETTASGAPAAPPLVSDIKRRGIDEGTVTIANFWPYAPTLFDYIRRSMPWTSPRSLTDDQVYALVAYILAQNKLIDAKQIIDAQSLPNVRMPNRDGFVARFPELMPPP